MAKASSKPDNDFTARLDPAAPVLVNAAHAIAARLEAVYVYAPFLERSDQVLQHHAMRIAAKHLRYTLEMFQEAYSASKTDIKVIAQAIDAVKSLQEHLGEIHDADVLVPQLTEHFARQMKDGFGKNAQGEPLVGTHFVDWAACQGLLTLCRDSQQTRDDRFRKLGEAWRQYQEDGFWERLRDVIFAAAAKASRPSDRTAEAATSTASSVRVETDLKPGPVAQSPAEPTSHVASKSRKVSQNGRERPNPVIAAGKALRPRKRRGIG